MSICREFRSHCLSRLKLLLEKYQKIAKIKKEIALWACTFSPPVGSVYTFDQAIVLFFGVKVRRETPTSIHYLESERHTSSTRYHIGLHRVPRLFG